MKLNITPVSKLGEEGGVWLKSLIDQSISKDSKYFKFLTDYRNLLAGKHWEVLKKKSADQVKMVVNLAHAHVRSLVPTIFFQNPTLDCAPTAPQHAGKEKIWNSLINNTLDKTGFAEECKKVVMDAVLYPEGILKNVLNKPAEGNDAQTTTEADANGPTVWLSKGSTSHVRICPNQLIVDYLVKDRDIEQARYIAIRYRKPLHELKKHPIYGKNIEVDFKQGEVKTPTTGNMVRKDKGEFDDWNSPEMSAAGDTNEYMVTIYEVWIHQLVSPDEESKHQLYQQMCVLLEGQDKPIRELTSWSEVMGEGFDEYPITQLIMNPVPDTTPVAELGVWASMQIGINWLMSRVTALVENDRQIYAADKSKIANWDKFKQQFHNGDSRVLAEVTDAGAMEMFQPTFVGRDNYTLINLLLQFIQQVSGIGQNRRGGSGIRTATEASLVDEGTRIKTDEKVDTMSKFLKKVFSKTVVSMRNLIKSRPDGTKWVFYIGGDVGGVDWINFNQQDVDWLPEVRIRINSFRKMDSTQEMQKLAGLLQSSLTMVQIYGPTIRADILFSRMLEAAGISDANKIVGSQDSEAMLQTVELAGIISGVPTPVLETHNHIAHKQIIELFRQSPFGQQLIASAPEIADRLALHEQEHDTMLMEQQQKMQNMQIASQNPFMAAGMPDNSNSQSEANSLTARDRTVVQSVPGGNGEFA